MKTKKRKTDKEKAWEQLVEATAVYLSTAGWQAFVIGNPRIQHKPGMDKSFNYEFVVRFTGKKFERIEEKGIESWARMCSRTPSR